MQVSSGEHVEQRAEVGDVEVVHDADDLGRIGRGHISKLGGLAERVGRIGFAIARRRRLRVGRHIACKAMQRWLEHVSLGRLNQAASQTVNLPASGVEHDPALPGVALTRGRGGFARLAVPHRRGQALSMNPNEPLDRIELIEPILHVHTKGAARRAPTAAAGPGRA